LLVLLPALLNIIHGDHKATKVENKARALGDRKLSFLRHQWISEILWGEP